jgi:hypothetical protein
MQTTFGQTDALALAVVAWLNTNAATFAVPVSAERRFRRKSDLTDIPKFNESVSVDVFPDSEAIHRESMSTFTSHYAIHVYMQQHVAGAPDVEAQCALLAQTHSEIMQGLRSYPFALANAVHPVNFNQLVFVDSKSADKGLYDLAALEQENKFQSDTILIFKAAV